MASYFSTRPIEQCSHCTLICWLDLAANPNYSAGKFCRCFYTIVLVVIGLTLTLGTVENKFLWLQWCRIQARSSGLWPSNNKFYILWNFWWSIRSHFQSTVLPRLWTHIFLKQRSTEPLKAGDWTFIIYVEKKTSLATPLLHTQLFKSAHSVLLSCLALTYSWRMWWYSRPGPRWDVRASDHRVLVLVTSVVSWNDLALPYCIWISYCLGSSCCLDHSPFWKEPELPDENYGQIQKLLTKVNHLALL